MNIIIRADVHHKIGMGHIMRCLKLLSYYDNNMNDITFICKKYNNLIDDTTLNKMYEKISINYNIDFIEVENDNYIDLNDMTTWLAEPYQNDCNKTIKLLKHETYLIIDHYSIDKKWEIMIKNHVKKIIVIEDYIKREHYCDIIINCTITNASLYNNLLNKNCKILLGMEYALIGKDFFIQDIGMREYNRISIFISGSDITDETSKIIRLCKIFNNKYNNKYVFDVIVGSLNINYSYIKNFCEKNKNFNLFYNIDNMAEILNKSYISIGSLGQSLFERMALKIPSIMMSIVDNQKYIIDTLIKSDTFIFFGNIPLKYDKILEESINKLYNIDIYKEKQINCEKFIKNIKLDIIFKELNNA